VSVILKTKLHWILKKGANLGLKFVRMRLAAGLCPDPLGELQHSPRPASRSLGGEGVPTSKGEEIREWEKGRKGWEGEGRTPVPD